MSSRQRGDGQDAVLLGHSGGSGSGQGDDGRRCASPSASQHGACARAACTDRSRAGPLARLPRRQGLAATRPRPPRASSVALLVPMHSHIERAPAVRAHPSVCFGSLPPLSLAPPRALPALRRRCRRGANDDDIRPHAPENGLSAPFTPSRPRHVVCAEGGDGPSAGRVASARGPGEALPYDRQTHLLIRPRTQDGGNA